MTDQIEVTTDQEDRVLRQEYWDAVRDIATDLEDAVKSGDIESEDDLNERMHESVDDSAWIIYTANNFQVLRYCDNHDAYTDEFGEVPMSGSEVNWAALAYAAMLEDVRKTTDDFDDIEKPSDNDEDDEEESEDAE